MSATESIHPCLSCRRGGLAFCRRQRAHHAGRHGPCRTTGRGVLARGRWVARARKRRLDRLALERVQRMEGTPSTRRNARLQKVWMNSPPPRASLREVPRERSYHHSHGQGPGAASCPP
jgi:hypothetical protein